MNKTYKMVLNQSTGKMVVASELAKGYGKGMLSPVFKGGTKALITLLCISLMSPVMAFTGNFFEVKDGEVLAEIYGAISYSDDQVHNNTILMTGGQVNGYIVGGWSSLGTASENKVEISDGTVKKNIIGGSSAEGSAHNNSVKMTGGQVEGSVRGGESFESDAIGNQVEISGGQVDGYVAGGWSSLGTVSENKVEISEGTVKKNLHGGYSEEGSAHNNTVKMTGGQVEGDITGGGSISGDAIGNRLDISGGQVVGNIHGGYSFEGNAHNNTVKMTGGTVSYIHAGWSEVGNSSENKVEISEGTVEGGIYGGYSVEGNAHNNTVKMTGGQVDKYIAGGWSSLGNVSENKVEISEGTVKKNIEGGFSEEGRAHDNTVLMTGGQVDGDITGGGSLSGDVIGNRLEISGGQVVGNIYGGYSFEGNAHNNTVKMTDGTANYIRGGWSQVGNSSENKVIMTGGVSWTIHGGHSEEGNAHNNTVRMTGGRSGDVSGGHSYRGDAIGNQVDVSGGHVDGYIVGGWSHSGNVSGNKVEISEGTVKDGIFGGYSSEGSAHNNTVKMTGGALGGTAYAGIEGGSGKGDVVGNRAEISGGNVDGDIYGGSSTGNGNALNNIVQMSGGQVSENIYGGWASNGNASDNKVDISAGQIGGNVYGGYAKIATNNTVTLSGNPIFSPTSSIYGGYINGTTGFSDVFTGNILNYSVKSPINIGTVANFEHYNFTIDPALANKETSMLTAQEIVFGADSDQTSTRDVKSSKIKVVGIHSNPKTLSVGDKFVLMSATNNITGTYEGITSEGIAQQGISLLYNVQTDVDLSDKKVMATIISSNRDHSNDGDAAASVNPQLKALSEGYLSGLMLVTRGEDMIADHALDSIQQQSLNGGISPFVLTSGSHNRYSSGSHIESNDFLISGGVGLQKDDLTIGAFVEGGWGSYDTYNSFNNAASVHGDGDTRYYGLGLLGSYHFDNGFYAEASSRFGKLRTKFNTNDIQNIATGEFADYNVNSHYISTHFGAGYVIALNDVNSLDFSTQYLWSTVSGKDVEIAGDHIHFNRVDSQRARLSAELNHQYSTSIMFNAGLGYEYEFDAKATATTYGRYQIDAPSMKGSTGILSLGISINPEANKNIALDFKADGTVGQRRGGRVSAQLKYNL